MAGSYSHVTNDDGTYAGVRLLDQDFGDATEAIDEMWFIILHLSGGDKNLVEAASDEFFRCMRGEKPWPPQMQSVMSER